MYVWIERAVNWSDHAMAAVQSQHHWPDASLSLTALCSVRCAQPQPTVPDTALTHSTTHWHTSLPRHSLLCPLRCDLECLFAAEWPPR